MIGIELGKKVKDTITGFSGIATARTVWLYGCTRILIEPTKLSKDNTPIEGQWFDEQRVEYVKKKEIKKEKDGGPGGPQKDPRRSNDPIGRPFHRA